VQQAALCGGAVMTMVMLSVGAFFTVPAPIEPAAELARDADANLSRWAGKWQITTIGLSKSVRAAVLLNCGQKVTAWIEPKKGDSESQKIDEEAQFLRNLLKKPGENVVILDSRDYEALPQDIQAGYYRIESKSAPEKRDLDQWLHQRPRSLKALVRGTQQTLYLILPSGAETPAGGAAEIK